MLSRLMAAVVATLAVAGPAGAAVVESQPGGFEISNRVEIAAPPAKVWEALARIGGWWNPQHTYSGDSKNLSLDLTAGGCFCERLAGGGSVRHAVVVYVAQAQALRLEGALGPLQGLGVTGHLTFTLKDLGGRTAVVETYDVGGWAKGGMDAWPAAVDQVLGEQLARLKTYAETGKTP